MKVDKVEFLSLLGESASPWVFKVKPSGKRDYGKLEAPFFVCWNGAGKAFGVLILPLKDITDEMEAVKEIDNKKAAAWVTKKFLAPDGTHYDEHVWTVPVTIEDVKKWRKDESN